ncbi:3,4-dihydroxy-2-butanone-4-phosphate synthase [Rickettsiales bacterium]|nr:3,4-dihydroxy-2-butanone-4-phosphate synthase [Rickettsiales bacterium]MDB2550240.1 3,4-dihydroxy-2-butanone-4-phosphate synthase [Rickettsiales bacterium]
MTNFAKIEEIIEDAKNGRMFILVDDENRENEGDIIIAAEKCGNKEVNFMAKNGRGLICLALEKERIKQLGLPMMSLNNNSRHQTAFTISIEAREGITTGISAADRAKTITDAINPNNDQRDIVSPGHIFPLQAKDGGVLVRAGHTEASVDIAKLAGLNPSAVICEIMNDDGTMARRDDLFSFAKTHNLKIATIADLIKYRTKNDKLVEKTATKTINSKFGGQFIAIDYKNKINDKQYKALIYGDINPQNNILVRMHHINFNNDILADNLGENNNLAKSMNIIAKNGSGVIVIFSESQYQEIDKSNDNILRNYGIGAQILNDIGVKNMTLLSKSQKSVIGLDGYGLKIIDYKAI